MKTFLYFLLATSLLAGCASKGPRDPGPHSKADMGKVKQSSRESIESKELASEEQTDMVTELVFTPGKTQMTSTNQKKIRGLFNKAQSRQNEIERVKIITWGDKEYPAKDSKLSQTQQTLVSKRNDAIEKFVKSINDKAEVEKISMAKPTGKVERAFASDESKTQDMVENTGLPTTASRNKMAGKASRSIVMLIPKIKK